ncbi:MAG: glucosaminidase domain-containing protein [Saprospiraceae bacterium]
MHQKLQLIKVAAQHQLFRWKYQVEQLVRRYWLRAFLLGLAAFLLIRKDVSINLNLNAVTQPAGNYENETGSGAYEPEEQRPMNVSMLTGSSSASAKAVAVSHLTTDKPSTSGDPNLANTYSNVTKYSDEDLAKREAKRKKQLAYVKRYAEVAQKEMDKYKIPASITLAQGLLESNVGESRLATKNNNHFGIKCFSRKCKKGHCTNFTDDSHKDFFRKYKSAWESFRAHSILLRADRYKPLYELKTTDYRAWAKGLKKAGYATDPNYAEKIIELIDDLGLHDYDE